MKSASISGVLSSSIVNVNHVDLIRTTDGIQAILDVLDVTDALPATDSANIPRNPSLVFFLRSPAEIKVVAPDLSEAGYGVNNPMANSIYSEEDKMLVIYNAESGDYDIEVIGTGNGDYHLDIGQLTEDGEKWNTLQDSITNEESDIYQLSFDANFPKDNPIVDDLGKLSLLLSKEKLKQLKTYVNNQNIRMSYKRRLGIYINSVIRSIDRALLYFDRGNYFFSSLFAYRAMGGCYNLRIRTDALTRGNRITDKPLAYIKNEANDAGLLLINAYAAIFESSGRSLSNSGVSRMVSIAERMNDGATNRLELLSGENAKLGSAFELSEQTLDKAQAAMGNNELTAANAYALISRLLSMEILRLMR